MDLTKIYFILLLIFIVYLSKIADKKNNKALLTIIIIILSLYSGLRGKTVGIDTNAYYYALENNFSLSYEFQEIGFRFISRFLLSIFHNPTILFLIYSYITIFLIVNRLWDYRKKTNFSYSIFLYVSLYFLSSMNIMRQYLAISIIFYSSKYLEEKKYFKFIIALIIAISMHSSAFLGIIYLIYYIFKNGIKTKKNFAIFLIIIMVGIFFGVGIMTKLYSKYGYYFLNKDSGYGIVNMYKLSILLLSLVLFNKKEAKQKNDNQVKNIKVSKEVTFLYFIGIVLSFLGDSFAYLTRVGYYFMLFEILYWSELYFKNRNKSLIVIILPISIVIYVFYVGIVKNGWGIFPYMFFWN